MSLTRDLSIGLILGAGTRESHCSPQTLADLRPRLDNLVSCLCLQVHAANRILPYVYTTLAIETDCICIPKSVI